MQIAPGLHVLGNKTAGHVRSCLIEDAGELTLIDTLLNHDGHLVLEAIAALGKKPGDLKRIILTHAHASHHGGLKALKAATGARVYSHDREPDVLAGKRNVDIPDTTGFWPQRPYRAYHIQLALRLGLGTPPPCEVDENLKDGDHIGPLTVMHVPGHTPGCLAFYWPEKRALFAGDIVATWPYLSLAWPGLTMDSRQNRESVGKLCDMVQSEILCVGHGDPVVKGGAETMRDLFEGRTPHPEMAKR